MEHCPEHSAHECASSAQIKENHMENYTRCPRDRA